MSILNPLLSQEMFGLAEVNYLGADATLTEKAYSPAEVASFFFPDTASAFYAYTTDWEDLAILFEMTMMSLRYDIDRDTAVTNLPLNPQSANDYKVSQGQRNRIAEERIRPRAIAAVQGLLPEAWLDAQAHLNSLTPIALCPGEGWVDNLTPACAGSSSLLRFTVQRPHLSAPMPQQAPRSFTPPTRR